MKKVKEIWRNIPGWEGYYQASNLGRVRSLERTVTHKSGLVTTCPALMRKPAIVKGRAIVTLCRDDMRVPYTVSVLVLMAFTGERKAKFTRHLDGDSLNNERSNLEWSYDYSELNVMKVRKARKMREKGFSIASIAEEFNVATSTMSRALRGESWKNVL